MIKILGIDYGSSKVGLALGDSELKVATPYKVIAPPGLVLEIDRLIERQGLDLVVLGLPLNMKGEETEQTRIVRQFAEELKKEISLDIVFEDERLTTIQAIKGASPTKPRARAEGRSRADAVAAMYILQSYLERTYG